MELRSRRSWMLCLGGIIAAGILSRVIQTGSLLFDKYLGDALYAAMIYAMVRLGLAGPAWRVAVLAMAIVIAIEGFQLTMIPARLAGAEQLWVRLFARLLGTHFSVFDLLAYVFCIACIWRADASSRRADGS